MDVLIKYNPLNNKLDPSNVQLITKLNKLERLLNEKLSEGLLIAFSGGVDSAFLLWSAKQVLDQKGGKLLALTTDSPSLPRSELNEAIEFTKDLGVDHKIENSKEFEDPNYMQNDTNRCYFCKKELFRLTADVIEKYNFKWIAYGYNESDRSDFRPGHKAALENNILAPLAEVGLSKEDIRTVLKANKIHLADKPPSPCLSSRIMTGIPISDKRLRDIEELETIIDQAGINIKRVRICKDGKDDFIRIEISKNEMNRFIKISDQLVEEGISRGYKWVTLDLAGYKMGGGNQ